MRTEKWVCLLRTLYLYLIINPAAATSVTLPPNTQIAFRQAVYHHYQREMATKGDYDAIKATGIQPKIRILDCLGENCLLDLVIDQKGWSLLYLATIRDNSLIGILKPIETYGVNIRKACFVKLKNYKDPAVLYVLSDPHRGVMAEQLFKSDSPNQELAINVFWNDWYKPGSKSYALKGEQASYLYFKQARQTLRTLKPPFVF